MLYTETYLKDDNYVRVGDLLRHILRKHIERIEVMLNKKSYKDATKFIHAYVEEVDMSLNKAHVVGQKEFKILSKIEYCKSRLMASIFDYEDNGGTIRALKVLRYYYKMGVLITKLGK